MHSSQHLTVLLCFTVVRNSMEHSTNTTFLVTAKGSENFVGGPMNHSELPAVKGNCTPISTEERRKMCCLTDQVVLLPFSWQVSCGGLRFITLAYTKHNNILYYALKTVSWLYISLTTDKESKSYLCCNSSDMRPQNTGFNTKFGHFIERRKFYIDNFIIESSVFQIKV